jgi:hypothetical protein
MPPSHPVGRFCFCVIESAESLELKQVPKKSGLAQLMTRQPLMV